MAKPQRILDPIHGLIKFDDTDHEQLIFRLVNCPEFQRLRRIRQLGFSEFVYPGATHSRFSHCLGAFHNARKLLRIIEQKSNDYDEDRAFATLCAALLHDLGHGPFSHTFEAVEKAQGKTKSHEKWTSEIIESGTNITDVLKEVGPDFPSAVAKIIAGGEGADIYASVVSSQFDADRLDYLKRDRYMTGIGSGDFDLEWLLDCLEVGKITIGQQDDYVDVPGFYLNFKGYRTAEGYLQARFQLYSMVYMHKTTRAAERMLAALITRSNSLLSEIGRNKLGISQDDVLVQYLEFSRNVSGCDSLELYLSLDDNVIWSHLKNLSNCSNEPLAELARRLMDRKLYKCFDAGVRTSPRSQEMIRFRKTLIERAPDLDLEWGWTLLPDDPRIEGYKWYDWESENALKKVLVDDSEQNVNIQDIAGSSNIVKSFLEEHIYRVYVPDDEAKRKIEALWKEITR